MCKRRKKALGDQRVFSFKKRDKKPAEFKHEKYASRGKWEL